MAVFSITSKVIGWKAIIAALRNASEESAFKITSEGIKFYGIVPGNWFVISLLWERENLDELTLEGIEKIIGFRTDDLDKIVKRFGNDDTITVSQQDEKDGYISIISTGRSWKLSTIHETMVEKLKEPKVDYDLSFSISPTQLKVAIDDSAIFSEYSRFVSKNGIMQLESSDSSGGSKSILQGIKTDKDAQTDYSIAYIKEVMSAVGTISESVKVSYSHQKPLLLEFDIIHTGTLRFHLAPRIDI